MQSNQEIIRIGQLEIRFLLESADTNGELTMFEFFVPAGAKVPVPHYHEKYNEVIYGLQGTMTFTIGHQKLDISPGQLCFIPRGITHGFTNDGQQDAKALAVATPGLIGPTYFKEVA